MATSKIRPPVIPLWDNLAKFKLERHHGPCEEGPILRVNVQAKDEGKESTEWNGKQKATKKLSLTFDPVKEWTLETMNMALQA